MEEKREVYNGYAEYYWTGAEIREHFKNAYECFGRHHGQVSSKRINFEKYYKKIKPDVTYRVFVSDLFCKIMDAETDKNVYFFGYTFERPAWAKN